MFLFFFLQFHNVHTDDSLCSSVNYLAITSLVVHCLPNLVLVQSSSFIQAIKSLCAGKVKYHLKLKTKHSNLIQSSVYTNTLETHYLHLCVISLVNSPSNPVVPVWWKDISFWLIIIYYIPQIFCVSFDVLPENSLGNQGNERLGRFVSCLWEMSTEGKVEIMTTLISTLQSVKPDGHYIPLLCPS